jgi:hypothetical protein
MLTSLSIGSATGEEREKTTQMVLNPVGGEVGGV